MIGTALASSLHPARAGEPVGYRREDHGLSEADLHDLPAGARRAARRGRRFRGGGLLHGSDSEDEAARTAAQDGDVAARPAADEGGDLPHAAARRAGLD